MLENVINVAGDAPIDARRRDPTRDGRQYGRDGRLAPHAMRARSRADLRAEVEDETRPARLAADRGRLNSALMSGGAKVTWSPHTCAYNRKRSLFHYKSVY